MQETKEYRHFWIDDKTTVVNALDRFHDQLESLYDFIVDHKEKNDGIAPTFREMSSGTGIPLVDLRDWLKILVNQGRLVIGNYKEPRNIKVVGGRWITPNDVDGKG